MSRTWLLPIIVSAAAALAVALLGSTITDLGPWYRSLAKPDWTPPDPVFGIAWTLIFLFAAIAGVSAWRASTSRTGDALIGLFALNGFLNVSWSLLFFRLHRPDWAFAELILLWLSIAALIVVCGRLSRLAGALLLPYLGWVSAAGLLNWQIIQLNAPFG